VLRGARLNLRPVERHVSQFHQSHALTDLENLQKQILQLLEMLAAKFRDPRMVRVIACREHPERNVLVGRLLQLPGGADPDAVAIEQKSDHHLRRIWARSPRVFLLVLPVDRRDVQFLQDIEHQIHRMILRQPLLQGRRQEKRLIRVPVLVSMVRAGLREG
jgi:hypothetical protein